MLLGTHVKMAKVLSDTLQIPNKKEFISGMRIPDSGVSVFFSRHIKANTLAEVRIRLDVINDASISPKAFSYNLGIVLHYVMDYFCKYHQNDIIFRQTIRHTLYEMNIALKLMCSFQHTTEIFLLRAMDMVNETDINTFDTVVFLEDQISEYLSEPQSIELDLKYAFTISYIIGLVLIYRWNRSQKLINTTGEYYE